MCHPDSKNGRARTRPLLPTHRRLQRAMAFIRHTFQVRGTSMKHLLARLGGKLGLWTLWTDTNWIVIPRYRPGTPGFDTLRWLFRDHAAPF